MKEMKKDGSRKSVVITCVVTLLIFLTIFSFEVFSRRSNVGSDSGFSNPNGIGALPPETTNPVVADAEAEEGIVVHDKGATFSFVGKTSATNFQAPVVPENPYLKK